MIRLLFFFAASVPVFAASTIQVPGDHPTIQQAIDAAKATDTVLVAPGTYFERITLKPEVILRSVAGAEKTIIDGSKGPQDQPGVGMAESAELIGFTVTRVGDYDDALWQKHWQSKGEMQTHDHIGEFGVPGIAIENITCNVFSNRVHHNGFTGIAVRGTHAAPAIFKNTCFRNMGGGIGIMAGAQGKVMHNTCYENFYAGIGHDNSSPSIVSNVCYGNVRAGIGISEGASPLVEHNTCYQNRRAGIGIRTGTNTAPRVIGNTCYENGMAGIGSKDGASPVLVRNRCYKNALAGIGARNGAHVRLQENLVYQNGAAGIGLGSGGGTAIITGCQVASNATVAVGIQPGWDVTLEKNQLSTAKGLPPVIMVFKDSRARFIGNTIRGGGVAGVRVAGEAVLENNEIFGTGIRKGGPPNFGIWALGGAKVTARNNEIKTWRHGLVGAKAEITLDGNTITDVHQHEVMIDGKPVKDW